MERCVTSADEGQNTTPPPPGPVAGAGCFPRAGEETTAYPRSAGSRFISVGKLTQCGFGTTVRLSVSPA